MENAVVPRRWLSNAEAAAYLCCSEHFLNKDRLTRSHGIPYYRLGRHIRYDLNDLDAILEQSKMATAPKKEKKPVEQTQPESGRRFQFRRTIPPVSNPEERKKCGRRKKIQAESATA